VFLFELLFFKGKRLKKDFAIDFDYNLIIFYLILIILANKAFFLVL
jgi:hypothetical protein